LVVQRVALVAIILAVSRAGLLKQSSGIVGGPYHAHIHPSGEYQSLGRVLIKSRLVTAAWIFVRIGPLADSSRISREV
jgi:hypothetical protein